MKKCNSILLGILICFSRLYAQAISEQADSLCRYQLQKSLSPTQIALFEKILDNRIELGIKARMDSIPYDYLYLEEQYQSPDSSIHSSEFYFKCQMASGYKNNYDDRDSLADRLYINGLLTDQRYLYYSNCISGIVFSGKYEHFYHLPEIIKRCEGMKGLQEISYDSSPAHPLPFEKYSYAPLDPTTYDLSRENQLQEELLKSSYQIVSLVDRVNNRILISIQLPAGNPQIEAYPFNFRYLEW